MLFYKACMDAVLEIKHLLDTTDPIYLRERLGIGEGGDRSLRADLLCEATFVSYLSQFGKIYSEERGSIGEGEAIIYLDPLDGSDNFFNFVPYYGVSVCMVEPSGEKSSFVANLANGDIFYKSKNIQKSTNLYSKRDIKTLNYEPTLGIFEKAYANPDIAYEMHRNSIKFRSPGALALSLVYGKGAQFCLFRGSIRVFDIIAALDFWDSGFVYREGDILLVARDGDIYDKILSIVKKVEQNRCSLAK